MYIRVVPIWRRNTIRTIPISKLEYNLAGSDLTKCVDLHTSASWKWVFGKIAGSDLVSLSNFMLATNYHNLAHQVVAQISVWIIENASLSSPSISMATKTLERRTSHLRIFGAANRERIDWNIYLGRSGSLRPNYNQIPWECLVNG